MKKSITQKLSFTPASHILLPAFALHSVTSKSGKGVYASNDVLFKGAIFGRDSIEVAEDLLHLKPKLVKNIILTLASLQGEEFDEISEEEPGKIFHEYRTAIVDGKPLNKSSKKIFEELSLRWGGNEEELVYYGSVDATPHFVRLIGSYVEKYGPKILASKITLRSGNMLSLRIVVENATKWLTEKIKNSKSGMIEYMRVNVYGIENQVWKDSREFYVHKNGEFANHNRPIASIEVQGLAYDALLAAAKITNNAEKAEKYRSIASILQENVFKTLWDEEENYFSLGIDYSETGKKRIIGTITANPAALLDTKIFDNLSDGKRQKYIIGIVTMIMSKDFLTDAGIRSRSLREGNLLNYWDYHGSFVTWPKETYDIAKGLKVQGFEILSKQLENRILNLVFRSGRYPEFVYVDEWGRVLTNSPETHEHGDFIIVDSTNHPENTQSWTVSAIYAIVANRLSSKIKIKNSSHLKEWQSDFEAKIIKNIPRVDRHINPWTLAAKYPTYPYKVVKDKSSISTDMPGR